MCRRLPGCETHKRNHGVQVGRGPSCSALFITAQDPLTTLGCKSGDPPDLIRPIIGDLQGSEVGCPSCLGTTAGRGEAEPGPLPLGRPCGGWDLKKPQGKPASVPTLIGAGNQMVSDFSAFPEPSRNPAHAHPRLRSPCGGRCRK